MGRLVCVWGGGEASRARAGQGMTVWDAGGSAPSFLLRYGVAA
jgi:hypothetical protein